MKYFKWVVTLFIICFCGSCMKDEIETPPPTTVVKIVNTVTGGVTVRLGSLLSPTVANNSSSDFFFLSGYPDIYVWPVGDSSQPYYNSGKGVSMAPNDYHSLFLCGVPNSSEGILVKESFGDYTDSVMGVRFVNLSPNSTPVNVTLSTATTTNVFANLPYKQVSEFKQFSATAVNTSYTFQVRSVANPSTVLASLAVSLTGTAAIPRFKNITLVFKGNISGTGVNAPTLVRINYY